jgi:hypothetical protein
VSTAGEWLDTCRAYIIQHTELLPTASRSAASGHQMRGNCTAPRPGLHPAGHSALHPRRCIPHGDPFERAASRRGRFRLIACVMTELQPQRVGLPSLTACPLPKRCHQGLCESQAAAARAHPTATWQRRLVMCGRTYTATTARNGKLACEWQSRCRGAVFQPSSPALANQSSAENKAKSVPTESNGKRWRNRGREGPHKLGCDECLSHCADLSDISNCPEERLFRVPSPGLHVSQSYCDTGLLVLDLLPSEPTPQKQ